MTAPEPILVTALAKALADVSDADDRSVVAANLLSHPEVASALDEVRKLAYQGGFVDKILDEIEAEDKAAQEARTRRIEEDNFARTRDLIRATEFGKPARVRVIAHPEDHYAVCDQGREGLVAHEGLGKTLGGAPSVYVTDLSAGDDNCPSRYHEPRHLLILEG